jgi:hypothetical protein
MVHNPVLLDVHLYFNQVLVPTSNDGYKTHLRGVAAMMQSRGPCAFRNGVAHLMFVGVRPLIVRGHLNLISVSSNRITRC